MKWLSYRALIAFRTGDAIAHDRLLHIIEILETELRNKLHGS